MIKFKKQTKAIFRNSKGRNDWAFAIALLLLWLLIYLGSWLNIVPQI